MQLKLFYYYLYGVNIYVRRAIQHHDSVRELVTLFLLHS